MLADNQCGVDGVATESTDAQRRKMLVVFFPEDSYTARLGAELAWRCQADREAIREPRAREGLGGCIRTAWQRITRSAAPILPPRRKPADYDLVVIGTPAWGNGPAAPIRRYLSQHADQFKDVAFFCVTEHRHCATPAFAEMEQLCRHEPVAQFSVSPGRSGHRSVPNERLRRFVASLQS
jgi:hypothetical protein